MASRDFWERERQTGPALWISILALVLASVSLVLWLAHGCDHHSVRCCAEAKEVLRGNPGPPGPPGLPRFF